MTNATETQENKSVLCPICDKGFKSNQARGIHKAKAHNKKKSNSAQDLLRKLKADLKEERVQLDNMILAVEHKIGQGK
tara:strand:+ start:102 stop:335 length:234 start_codon:yes stop_codon:yes gene_type:complete